MVWNYRCLSMVVFGILWVLSASFKTIFFFALWECGGRLAIFLTIGHYITESKYTLAQIIDTHSFRVDI